MDSFGAEKSQQEDKEPQASTSKDDETKENTNTYGAIIKDEESGNRVTKDDVHKETAIGVEQQSNQELLEIVPREQIMKDDISIVQDDIRPFKTHVKPQITITADSTPSPERKDSLKRQLERGKQSSSDSQSKGRCPIYFGIKSYLHDFYDPPDKDVVNSGEYIQEDDFEFVVEPGKRRWRDCWFRTGLWVGINLILLGVIALLVGHLTPARNTIVGHQENLEILDRWAIAFNRRLELCRLAGLVVFCCGGVVVMITLLISSYQQETTYYVMGATVVPEMFVGNPLIGRQQRLGAGRIPVTGSIRNVQPAIFMSQH